MSIETHVTARDRRTALVREKYFSLRPKPLERWLWQQLYRTSSTTPNKVGTICHKRRKR